MEKFPTVFLVTRIAEKSYQELISKYIQKGYQVVKEEKYESFDDGSWVVRVEMRLINTVGKIC